MNVFFEVKALMFLLHRNSKTPHLLFEVKMD